jgi:solute carrier family 30 (zinc transporter), member 5/7
VCVLILYIYIYIFVAYDKHNKKKMSQYFQAPLEQQTQPQYDNASSQNVTVTPTLNTDTAVSYPAPVESVQTSYENSLSQKYFSEAPAPQMQSQVPPQPVYGDVQSTPVRAIAQPYTPTPQRPAPGVVDAPVSTRVHTPPQQNQQQTFVPVPSPIPGASYAPIQQEDEDMGPFVSASAHDISMNDSDFPDVDNTAPVASLPPVVIAPQPVVMAQTNAPVLLPPPPEQYEHGHAATVEDAHRHGAPATDAHAHSHSHGAPAHAHSHGAPSANDNAHAHSHGAPATDAHAHSHSHGAPAHAHSHGAPSANGNAHAHSHGAPATDAHAHSHSHGAPAHAHSHGAPAATVHAHSHSHGTPAHASSPAIHSTPARSNSLQRKDLNTAFDDALDHGSSSEPVHRVNLKRASPAVRRDRQSNAAQGTPSQHGHSHSHGDSNHGHSHSGNKHNHSHSSPKRAMFATPEPSTHDVHHKRSLSDLWNRVVRPLWNQPQSRLVLIFTVMQWLFATLQLGHGVAALSVGLMTESFHSYFDVGALAVSLAAMYYSKKRPSFVYSYGLQRTEVLGGFTNALFLIFVAVFQLMESFHNMYKPVETHSTYIFFAILAIAMDLAGMFMFRDHAILTKSNPNQSGFRPRYSRTSNNTPVIGGREMNMHGVFLHVFCDLLANLGYLVSAWVSTWSGIDGVHGFMSLSISIIILWLVRPLFHATGVILLQSAPESMNDDVERCIRQISTFEGVLECRSEHWWSSAPNQVIGSLHIRVRADADEQEVLCRVSNVLRKHINTLTIQVEKDQWVLPDVIGASMSIH